MTINFGLNIFNIIGFSHDPHSYQSANMMFSECPLPLGILYTKRCVLHCTSLAYVRVPVKGPVVSSIMNWADASGCLHCAQHNRVIAKIIFIVHI